MAVVVQGEDAHTTNTLESHLKRELRLLGDVDIVEGDENWQFVLAIQYREGQFMDGTNTGYVALASAFNERIPDFYFKALWLEILKRQPVYVELPAVAYYNRNRLNQFCVSAIGGIDKKYLTPARKLLR